VFQAAIADIHPSLTHFQVGDVHLDEPEEQVLPPSTDVGRHALSPEEWMASSRHPPLYASKIEHLQTDILTTTGALISTAPIVGARPDLGSGESLNQLPQLLTQAAFPEESQDRCAYFPNAPEYLIHNPCQPNCVQAMITWNLCGTAHSPHLELLSPSHRSRPLHVMEEKCAIVPPLHSCSRQLMKSAYL